MHTCLVTGVAGFIGSQLAEALLRQDNTVIGIDCLTDYYPASFKHSNLAALLKDRRFTLNGADLSGDYVLPGGAIDYVFHLAAQPGVRASWDSFEVYARHNIVATQKLLNHLRGRSIRRLIFASSSSVYGDAARLPAVESDPLRPMSPYGVTKLAAESLCFAYSREFGLPATVLRYFTVYGPRQRPDMGLHIFMKAILEGRPLTIYGSLEQQRDYTYVDDVVRASLQCMSGPAAPVLNISGGTKVSLQRCIEALREVTDLPVDVQSADRQKGVPSVTHADTSLAKDQLGFSPQISFEEGLGRQWSWIRAMDK